MLVDLCFQLGWQVQEFKGQTHCGRRVSEVASGQKLLAVLSSCAGRGFYEQWEVKTFRRDREVTGQERQ